MTENDKKNIRAWFFKNFRTHTDWTGTYIEYHDKCTSVEELFNIFVNAIE